MRTAIVGAAGFFGNFLCRHFQRCGWEVFGYDLAAPSERVEGVRYAALDVTGEAVAVEPETDVVGSIQGYPSQGAGPPGCGPGV